MAPSLKPLGWGIDTWGDQAAMVAKPKPVWNTDTNARSFYEYDAKGIAVAFHSVYPGDSVLLPKHERDRLISLGGWTDQKPQAVKDAEEAEKEARESRLVAAREELAAAEDALKEEA